MPHGQHAGVIEYAHRAQDAEYVIYRLSFGSPPKTARFDFENTRLQPQWYRDKRPSLPGAKGQVRPLD